MEKIMVSKVPNHIPKLPVNKSSLTLWSIWVAKEAHAGGADGSNPSILDALIDASKDPGDKFVSTELGLSNPSSPLRSSPVPLPSTQLQLYLSQGSPMAFQRADPWPFAPPGFDHHKVQHRATMARAVMRLAPQVHEDYAIVSIDPIPANPLRFHTVWEVVEEFLKDHMHVGKRDVQPKHLEQALVRFENIFDRDLLINNSHHPYDGFNFHVVRQNVARNWRVVQFNQECWLMLLGFLLDYWNNYSIQSALASFSRMPMWENDRDHLARLMVRACVSDLRELPYFLVLTESEGFQGESWTVQVGKVEQEMFGALLADEDHFLVCKKMETR
jgi:hypothetical protein